MEGTVAPGRVVDCKDLRDGEAFTIHSEKISNIQVWLGGPTCFDAIDDHGKKHLGMCSDQQAWLKCEPRA